MAGLQTGAWESSGSVTYSLDLDIGEVADGYHLIARSISLYAKDLLFELDFSPEPTEGAQVWPNMFYNADIPRHQGLHRGRVGRAIRAASTGGPVRMVRLLPA